MALPFIENCLALKALWWYKHILDAEGTGILTKDDFNRCALKYAILYCKGDKIKDFCEIFHSLFSDLWNSIKATGRKADDFTLDFTEFYAFICRLSSDTTSFDQLPKYLQQLIDMLFESYDAKSDNGIDEDEYRLYLCARNMNIKSAHEHFQYMTKGSRPKIGKPQFRELMFKYLTSNNDDEAGKYICGPYNMVKKEDIQAYFKKATNQ